MQRKQIFLADDAGIQDHENPSSIEVHRYKVPRSWVCRPCTMMNQRQHDEPSWGTHLTSVEKRSWRVVEFSKTFKVKVESLRQSCNHDKRGCMSRQPSPNRGGVRVVYFEEH